MFEKILFAGWGDMDFNSHMRNTAFLDKSADVRMMFFAENGLMEEHAPQAWPGVMKRWRLQKCGCSSAAHYVDAGGTGGRRQPFLGQK
jgi:hypothetical protein